jgi:hypothetical protein
VSSTDGVYELDKVAAGSYQVGINTRADFENRGAFGRPAYFPGVTAAERATSISLTAGEHREIGDLVLPSEIRFVQVSGLVVAEDGRPAAGAKIFVHGADERTRVFSGPLVTTGDGRFIVAIPAGERASLVVEWPRPVPEKPYNWERGDVPPFLADRDRADLRVVVRPIKQ